MGAKSAKELLKQDNNQRYTDFTLNGEESLDLPVIPTPWWVAISGRAHVYKKIFSHPKEDNHVRFIYKNENPHSFLWQTTPELLKKGVRWGIVRAESITAKVIASLGNYRVIAHERIAKGMMSNTQSLKLKLLDLYQERFEALQDMESLVNTNSSKETYQLVIEGYIEKLKLISTQLESQFCDSNLLELQSDAIAKIRKDLDEDIKRARVYLSSLREKDSLKSHNRARGNDSILEFVKRQMLHNLYELQGINQDLTYSNKKRFALTRGELNDCIEDARKEIDDHHADPRNAVTAKHHGAYSASSVGGKVTYDFAMDNISPARERQILLAISFVEGWDKVENAISPTPSVSNASGSEPLSTVTATYWQIHRNFIVFLKKTAYFLLNMVKSIFAFTHPWEEESWSNKDFHLVAATLRKSEKPNEPLWRKPFYFFKSIGHAFVDMVKGVRNIGVELVINLPYGLFNDWAATKALPTLDAIKQQAEDEIKQIQGTEKERLEEISRLFKYREIRYPDITSTLAKSEYLLTSGEANDILTSIVHGVDAFSSVFTHGIYAKDPVAGLVFTAGYAIGGAAILLPAFSSTLFSSAYVGWFTNFSYTMGATKLAATIAGGSTQAQLFATVWDTFIRGPHSTGVQAMQNLLENPLTVAAYLGAAYGLGYVLANGIGYPIPGLSEILKEDMGSVPEASYPVLGAKIAIALFEAFDTHSPHPYHQVRLNFDGKELAGDPREHYEIYKKTIERFRMASWLSANALVLPKLKSSTLFNIERHIDALFKAEDAVSLKKILYPEKERSIAYQLFSIPLTYIPVVLRVVSSLVIGAVAWGKGHPFPSEPFKIAMTVLGRKIVKDMNCLIACGVAIVHLSFKLASTLVKALAYVGNMIIGRIAGAAGNWHLAHKIHKFFAFIHVLSNKIGEFFYPTRAAKSVVFAHPVHTVKVTEDSYYKLLSSIGDGNPELKAKLRHYQDHHSEGAKIFALSSQPGKESNYSGAHIPEEELPVPLGV